MKTKQILRTIRIRNFMAIQDSGVIRLHPLTIIKESDRTFARQAEIGEEESAA